MADVPSSSKPRYVRRILQDRQENNNCQKPATEQGQEAEAEEMQIMPNSVQPEHYVNFNLAPGEWLIQCPYDKSHRILPSSMGNHIDRCRTNYKKKLLAQGLTERFIICPWDEAHIVSEVESAYHAAQCLSRFQRKEKPEDLAKYAPKSKILNPPELQALETEDWEADSKGTYDPKKKLAEQPVFTTVSNLSKSAKKEFREQQRLKFYTMVSGPFWEDYQSTHSKLALEKEMKLAEESRASAPPVAGPARTTLTDGPAVFLPNLPSSDTISTDFNRAADTLNWIDGQYVRGRGHYHKNTKECSSTKK